MANATVTISTNANNVWLDGRMLNVIGTFVISANPDTYPTGGLTVNFGSNALVKAQRAPQTVQVNGQAGYVYAFVPGTNNTNGKLKIFTTGAAAQSPLAELTNGTAIPAAVSGDVINFEALFLGQN